MKRWLGGNKVRLRVLPLPSVSLTQSYRVFVHVRFASIVVIMKWEAKIDPIRTEIGLQEGGELLECGCLRAETQFQTR